MAGKIRSPLWYELPLMFHVIGGVICFLLIRNDDPVKAKRCLVLGIGLTVIPILFAVGIFGFIGSTSTFVIASNSMNPEFEVNDIVMVDDNYPFEKINIGDIIVFNRPSDHDRVIAHRVITILDEDPKTLRTKGDANAASIPGTDFPITEKEYIGKIVDVLPDVGGFLQLLKPPVNYFIWFVNIGVLIIPVILHIRFRKKVNQTQIPDEQEE